MIRQNVLAPLASAALSMLLWFSPSVAQAQNQCPGTDFTCAAEYTSCCSNVSCGCCGAGETSCDANGCCAAGTTTTPCDGYPVCGNACTNAINPVCCPDGLIAETEADCTSGSSSSCAFARPAAPSDWLTLPVALGALGLLCARRRRR